MRSELTHDDPEVRRHAVTALERSSAGDRAEQLLRALGDGDWRVRKEAVRVAFEVAESWSFFEALVDALAQGENVGLRNAALEVLERLGTRSAAPLLASLPRVPDRARKFLVAALGAAGDAALEALAELSRDPEPNTAQAAIEALARCGGPGAADALRTHLASEDPVQRLAALEGLDRLEAVVSVEELRPSLEDRLVRRLALRLLGFGDATEAVPILVEALGSHGSASAEEATLALGRVLERGGEAAHEVSRAARELPADVRTTLRAFATLGRDPTRRAAAWLLLLARDPGVLGVAAELAAEDRLAPATLGAIREWGADAVEPLLAAMSELGRSARAAALELAADLATESGAAAAEDAVRAALRATLQGEDVTPAASAAAALERLGEPSDAPALVAAAHRFGEPVARPAGRALTRLAISAPEAVEAALLSVSIDGPIGAALLPAVAALRGPAATDLLQAALSADDPRARRAAVLALGGLEPQTAVELAGFALADEDLSVQTAAVMVLAATREAAAIEHLRVALHTNVEPVVASAARALGALGDRASAATLRELVSEGRPGVGVAAMEALRALEDPSLDDLLVEALGQSDEELVKEALRAIAERAGARRGARIALALEHAAWDVRQLAARLLGEVGAQVGGEAAQAALRDRLTRETDDGVRDAIRDALRAGGGDA